MGGRPQLRAAIEFGADAVYFGLDQLNARARAANFTVDELPEIMGELHERGVLGFVTLNTLVFDTEWDLALRLCEAMVRARVDAVIVQDLGLCQVIARRFPELPIHGSTQMTVTSAEGADLVATLGAERVVLGRELSVSEIAAVVRATTIECEVFVHGALCVSYSGQCFSSEAWGGRSANRGQCAQACRLPYGLVVDGVDRPSTGADYLLSPQDLAGIEHVPALLDAGVACFKIEGRLKGPEYVAVTTAAYRRAVDAAWAGAPWKPDAGDWRRLEQVFSRGLTPGFLDGVRHQRLVHGRFPKHRGVRLGKVRSVSGGGVELSLDAPVRAGLGVVFDSGRPQEEERGGRVELVERRKHVVESADPPGPAVLRFGSRTLIDDALVGATVWSTHDPAIAASVGPMLQGPARRRVPVTAVLRFQAGEPAILTLTDAEGRSSSAVTDRPVEAARGVALQADGWRAALDRFGDTPFQLVSLKIEGEGPWFLPPSSLHRARRAASDALLLQRRHRTPAAALPPRVESRPSDVITEPVPATPQLSVLCRTPDQVRAALALPFVREVVVDFLEVRGLGAAVSEVQASGRRAIAATPRVLKPDEERIRHFFLKLGADALLVRSLGLLHSLLRIESFQRPPLHGDFSLNAANSQTVKLLLDAGLTRLTPTHDLDRDQLLALAAATDVGRLELIAHHHLPIFHTEHCVFARFLSDGNGPTDCGRPCESHTLHLRGRDGQLHLVQADVGCRNTVFNHEAQSAASSIRLFVQQGWRRFRVELADHLPEHVAPLLTAYLDTLTGALSATAASRAVRSAAPYGTTLGSLRVLSEPAPEDRKRPGWMS